MAVADIAISRPSFPLTGKTPCSIGEDQILMLGIICDKRREINKLNDEKPVLAPTPHSERYHIALNRLMALKEIPNAKHVFVKRVKAERVPEYK